MNNRSTARIAILSHLFQFKIAKITTGGHPVQLPNSGFITDGLGSGMDIPIDTLVAVFCAPTSKYYLSWLKEIRGKGGCGAEYLLESIEDGELCWWNNVQLCWLPLDYVQKFPEWRWTDEQFAFRKKWFSANNDYMIITQNPIFLENNKVRLGIRRKWDFNDTSHREIEFPNWKKLTKKEMTAFIKSD